MANTNKSAKSNGCKRGRPTKYKPEYVNQVYKLCLLGATDAQLSDFFDINKDTLSEWKKSKHEFSASLKEGKLQADSEMAESLYHRAKGYSHPEEKIFQYEGEIIRADTVKHYPPDATSLIFWLKNRQPALWRDKHDITVKGAVLHLSMDLGDGKPVELNAAPEAIVGVVEGEDGDSA